MLHLRLQVNRVARSQLALRLQQLHLTIHLHHYQICRSMPITLTTPEVDTQGHQPPKQLTIIHHLVIRLIILMQLCPTRILKVTIKHPRADESAKHKILVESELCFYITYYYNWMPKSIALKACITV